MAREESGIRYMCDMSAKDHGRLHVVYVSPLHKQSRNIESAWDFSKIKYRICNVHSASGLDTHKGLSHVHVERVPFLGAIKS